MHVLFLGHTGIGKERAVRNLANSYLAKRGLVTGLDHIDSPDHVRESSLEAKLPEGAAGIDVRGFLDIRNEFQARAIWRDAFNAAIDSLSIGSPDAHQFLSLHATYYRAGVIYSRADIELIRMTFQPDMVVTLIDDIYEVASEIVARDEKDALRLREIATWRAVETLVGDFVAKPAKIPNYVVAVKHPTSVLEQLLFEPKMKRVYCAFPISRTRQNSNDRAEINDFKTRLRGIGVTVFDPVTIDDLILIHALNQSASGETVIVRDADRWELTDPPLLCDDRARFHDGSDRQFSRAEVEEVTVDLNRQVETRDFRLIEDSNAIVAYRPHWGGIPSRGVTAELRFAQDRGRRIFIYSPTRDDAPLSVFEQFPNVYAADAELLTAVESWKASA